ncbi:MAG TPA: response regulator [Candidatus Omnitrophota bacterium]|nr:response regulator [Candidatus Omnitrophota bacterium]HRZ14412.1 response regulator [Candidatus Omnitrophota bacterium]
MRNAIDYPSSGEVGMDLLKKQATKPLKKRIMVVDDDKEFLEELKETLLLSGYEVKEVRDSTKATGLAAEIKPDLILLDLRMQGMTGFEVANKLRAIPETKKIPILVMSGYFTEEKDGSLLSFFNMQNYLQKPFNPLDVIYQIERLLKEAREQ